MVGGNEHFGMVQAFDQIWNGCQKFKGSSFFDPSTIYFLFIFTVQLVSNWVHLPSYYKPSYLLSFFPGWRTRGKIKI